MEEYSHANYAFFYNIPNGLLYFLSLSSSHAGDEETRKYLEGSLDPLANKDSIIKCWSGNENPLRSSSAVFINFGNGSIIGGEHLEKGSIFIVGDSVKKMLPSITAIQGVTTGYTGGAPFYSALESFLAKGKKEPKEEKTKKDPED